MSPAELELCARVGLVREIRPGVYELTHAGRCLLGERPPRPPPEPHAESALHRLQR